MTYDVAALRHAFPALASGIAHFDGPGGTQTPAAVGRAVAATLTGCPTALLLAAIQAALLLAAALLAATAVWPLTATLATILVALAAFGAASIWPR